MPKVQAAAGAAPTRGRGRRVAPSPADINVVPLVDVMLALLIIFMVTAPMIQRGLDVTLPVARRAQPVTGERTFVTVPISYRQNRTVYIDNQPVRIDVFQERIRQLMESRSNKDVYL